MAVSSVPLMPRPDVEEYLKSFGFPPSEIEAALAHRLGLAFDGPDGKKVILLNRGEGYEKVDPDEFDEQTRSMHAAGVTIMRALVDEPGEPKQRRVGSSMPIDPARPLKSGTVFFSAPSLSPQTTQEIYVGQTLTLPIVANAFTGDQVSLKVDPFPLPPGASFTDHGDGSGTLTFTPQIVGAWDFIFTASDGIQQLSQSVIVVAKRVPPTQTVAKPDPKE